jgi:hypothetical protein
MPELAGYIDFPRQKWVCGNKHCDIPYRSTGLPDEQVCLACGNEAVWKLLDSETDALSTRLETASVGDTIQYSGFRTSNWEAEITDITDSELVLDDDEERIHISELIIHEPHEDLELGSALFHVELNPDNE